MITKESYGTASFIDSGRTTIEVLLKTESEDVNEFVSYTFPANEDNSDYQDLLKIISLDELHEITHEKKKAEGHEIKAIALRYARESGLIAEYVVEHSMLENPAENKLENKLEKKNASWPDLAWPGIVDSIFDNKNDSEEDLFALKLALFEVEKIRSSKNAAAKTKLRKSKTKFEVLNSAFEIAAEADAAAALLPVPEKKKKVANKSAPEKKVKPSVKKDTDGTK
tara:strand:- start:1647 stop:2321 length:675 start_codon:yes stop_codon:yes gene_type:complete